VTQETSEPGAGETFTYVQNAHVPAFIYHRSMYVSLQDIYSSHLSPCSVMMPSERYVSNDIYRMCAQNATAGTGNLGNKKKRNKDNFISRTSNTLDVPTTVPPLYSLSSLSSLSSSSARISNFFLFSFGGSVLTLGGVGICAFRTRPDKPIPPPPTLDL
jgi:hypothetical protein